MTPPVFCHPVPFTAALLLGGRSRRLGSDKATLIDPRSGRSLQDLQLATLRALRPAALLLSLRPGQPRPCGSPDGLVVRDAAPGAGPLGGLVACLERAETDLLLVLAVDLPRMTAEFLHGLLALAEPGRGVVPRRGGRWEPLAAVYPVSLLPLAKEHLAASRFALQGLLDEALQTAQIREHPLNETDSSLFWNLNLPEDRDLWISRAPSAGP